MSQSSAIFSAVCDAQGVLHIERPVKAAMTAYARSLKNRQVEIVIRAKRVGRSAQANRFYWGVLIAEIAAAAGYRRADAYQLHDALAHKFLPLQPCPITGSPRRQRTPETDTAEFSAYCDQVIQWAAETWGLVIPDPSTVEPGAQADGMAPRAVDRVQGWGVTT